MISKKSKIFVTGHKGLVGSALIRKLKKSGFRNVITVDKKKLDLRDQKKVYNFLNNKKIDAVINAAAKVGGIHANDVYKAQFIYDNLTNFKVNIYYLSEHKPSIKKIIYFSVDFVTLFVHI